MYVVGKAWVCQLCDLECFLGSHTLKWPVGVVFIATNQNLTVGEVCWRRAHRTVRCATGQCPVRCHVILPLGLGVGRPLEALSSCGTGQSGAPLTSALTFWITLFTLQSRPLRADSRYSAGAPDSPVAHRTVRWIIAELRLGNPKLKSLRAILPGAPDTVRWHTGQSGAPDHGSLRFPFCSFLLSPNLFFWLVCVEPLAHVECIILNKLVSPIICVGQFNHQNQLGKGLTLFPFHSLLKLSSPKINK
jgi:hypothetical protein